MNPVQNIGQLPSHNDISNQNETATTPKNQIKITTKLTSSPSGMSSSNRASEKALFDLSVSNEQLHKTQLRGDIKDSPSISKGYSGLNQQESTNIELSLWVHGYRPVARDDRSIPPKSLRHKKTSLMSTLSETQSHPINLNQSADISPLKQALDALASKSISNNQIMTIIREFGVIEPKSHWEKVFREMSLADMEKSDLKLLLNLPADNQLVSFISLIPECHLTPDICQLILNRNPECLKEFPEKIKTREEINLRSAPKKTLFDLKTEEKTLNKCRQALSESSKYLKAVPEAMLDNHPELLDLIPKCSWTNYNEYLCTLNRAIESALRPF